MVFSGLSTAWRLASWPTRRSPVLANPTTEGVKRLPSSLGITVGCPPSITATTEFVVPRSMTMILLILLKILPKFSQTSWLFILACSNYAILVLCCQVYAQAIFSCRRGIQGNLSECGGNSVIRRLGCVIAIEENGGASSWKRSRN